MCVCLSVGLSAFYRPHDICPLCGAASEFSESRISRRRRVASGPARGGKRMHSESTRAHAVQLLNEKIAALIYDALQKQSRTRAHAVVYVTGEISKKKTNMPLPKFSLQFAFSWSVYFSNRTESYSSQIEFAGPMESRRTRRPTFTAEERLERRREQDRRRHEERRARQRREQTQARRDVECLRCSQARA